jgi:hypothetical protein
LGDKYTSGKTERSPQSCEPKFFCVQQEDPNQIEIFKKKEEEKKKGEGVHDLNDFHS